MRSCHRLLHSGRPISRMPRISLFSFWSSTMQKRWLPHYDLRTLIRVLQISAIGAGLSMDREDMVLVVDLGFDLITLLEGA